MNDLKCHYCRYYDKGVEEYPCNKCVHNGVDHFAPTTNLDRIRGMSVSALADFICDIYASNEHREIRVGGTWMHPEDVEAWLVKEVNDGKADD